MVSGVTTTAPLVDHYCFTPEAIVMQGTFHRTSSSPRLAGVAPILTVPTAFQQRPVDPSRANIIYISRPREAFLPLSKAPSSTKHSYALGTYREDVRKKY